VHPNIIFNPRNNLNFNALGNYWGTPDSFTGWISNTAVLRHTLTINGYVAAMQSKWSTKQEMIDEFLLDLNTFLLANGKTAGATVANIYNYRDEIATGNPDYASWMRTDLAARQKWAFLFQFLAATRTSQSLGFPEYFILVTTDGITGSTGTMTKEIEMYFKSSHNTAWPVTSNYTTGFNLLPAPLLLNPTTYTIDTTGKAPGYPYYIEWKTINSVTGIEAVTTMKYVVTQVYTPRIQVNNLALLKSQGDAFNIRSIATATDGYGNDISQYLVFSTEKELNPKSLQAGTYPITISIVDQQFGIKRAEKQVFLKVADLTAPQVSTRNLVLPFGALFNIRDGFVSAFDNVDGNLLGAQDYNPFVQMSDPIPANRAGLYVIEYEVYDRTGNSTSGVFTVRILADYQTEIMTKLNTLSTTAQINTMKTELLAALATLDSGTEADILAARNHLAGLIGDLGDDVDTSVTGAKTALETLINGILADLEVSVVEAVEAIPAQDNTATIVAGSAATVSSLGVGAGVILLLLKRR
jgi:hypothetical protein